MNARKLLNIVISLVIIAANLLGSSPAVKAMPMDPMDETKVPHYFGPYPNWANSPLTLPDAQVVITGDGSGAEAVATVGANGVITAITITNPGHNYSNAKVDILGSGTGATADVVIVKKGAVVAVTVDTPGLGYTAPVVTFSGNGGASATAYGGVESVTLTDGGLGYTMPTVEFDMPDGPDGVQAEGFANMDANGTIISIDVLNPGSGYSFAPGVAIHNGTLFDPIAGAQLASATTALSISAVSLDTFGAGYNSAPSVTISDPTGSGATATAFLDNGIISEITLKKSGSGYLTPGGIRKFVDTLPGLGSAAANNLGQYIPVAVPDTTTFPGADYYEIAVVEFTEQMHSDLPATKLRGYVQLETSVITGAHYALPGGKFGVEPPHYLGPTIVAQKDRAVRITFYNLLPNGAAGDLFLPVDTTLMGSGEAQMDMMYDPVPVPGGDVMDEVRNPMCTDKYMDPMMREMCFTENRATLHLHGGNSPWISDGTPHQWITPADEITGWPEGVSVESVPDMVGQAAIDAGVPDCSLVNDGCQTFYYTNQQSARLMFYHDHSWGITRLNVYAGEAAGYIITDPTEQSLVTKGIIPSDQIPLIIQDRTFVPDAAQLAAQDPTWDTARWGSMGNFWYHHVYMPAQNPGDPGGMSSYGRWMYGPWFWPPAGDAKYGPIANPYYNMDPATNFTTPLAVPCNLDDPATWQYQVDPFCEPEQIPGTPNISVGMEQFNDTPMVNGTAYPTVTLEPKTYRFRVLNAANDRFFNFQWYVADPTTASTGLNGLGEIVGGTEVALKADEVAAAQLDPVVFPTPDTLLSPAGPDWVQIATEGGFLPKPVVVDGQQVTTWITDPTRFDVGNVDQHSLLLAPAERADVIVDFSKFAGQTLILYNDAPAAFPARVPSYDYYTGYPDQWPNGPAVILPGYGPNTRTVMQVKIAGTAAAPAFNVNALNNAFTHKANGSGVFESGQAPIIVGQAAYNSAYGTSFASGGNCSSPSSTIKCDGFARINQQGGDPFTFDTLLGATKGTWSKISIPIEPKAIHDEMNASNFDEFGRMTANLGVEVVPATPGLQNVVLHPYVFPMTEIVNTTNLPKAMAYDANGIPVDVKIMPISSADDGTQIWKITHNGVDTHPIHFHAYDVQVLNRVTWDNIIIPPDATELGWKDTVRISPLEDTIVALRAVVPLLPFDLPNSIRLISPMMADGVAIDLSSVKDALGLGMSAFAPNGEPIDIYNHYVNFGAEYVYHCHILSHEEMDMMRPVILAYPPVAPSGLAFDPNIATLSWIDKSLSETAFVVEKSQDGGQSWIAVNTVFRDLDLPNTTGDVGSFTDPNWVAGDQYRVVAQNTVGDTTDYSNPNLNEILPGTYAFPVVTTEAISEVLDTTTPPAAPDAPSGLTATAEAGPQVSLAWVDNSTVETGFSIQRSTDGVVFSDLATVVADTIAYVDTAVSAGVTYTYQVSAFNVGGPSAFSNTASAAIPGLEPPLAPDTVDAQLQDTPRIDLTWVDNSLDETGFVIERSTDGVNFSALASVAANFTAYSDLTVLGGFTYTYRVAAVGLGGTSAFAVSNSVLVPPDATPPAAPSGLFVSNVLQTTLTLNWLDNSNNETGFVIQRATDTNFTKNLVSFLAAANATSFADSGLKKGTRYFYRVQAVNGFNGGAGPFPWSAALNVTTLR